MHYSSENKKAKPNNMVDVASNASPAVNSSTTVISSGSSVIKSSASAVGSSSSINNPSLTVANPSSSVVESSKRVITIKSTIKNIWNQNYPRHLYDLVDNVNTLVSHIFGFSKYIFLEELKRTIDFNLADFVNKEFFVEVFLALVSRRNIAGRLNNRTIIYRELISRHKASYFQNAQYTPFELKYAQQLALYECTKINTAYQNNIKTPSGNRLHVLLNNLSKREEKLHSLHQSMKAKGSTEQAMKEARRKKVFEPITRMKLSVSKKEVPFSDVLDEKALSCIRALLSTYPSTYKFEKNSIYYDVKVHPEKHFKAFYKIAELLETEKAKKFNFFPIRTLFISCYIYFGYQNNSLSHTEAED